MKIKESSSNIKLNQTLFALYLLDMNGQDNRKNVPAFY